MYHKNSALPNEKQTLTRREKNSILKYVKKKSVILSVCAIVLFLIVIALQFVDVNVFDNDIYDGYLKTIFVYCAGVPLCFILLSFSGYGVFNKPRKIYCFLVALVISINNFPFSAYFKGVSYVTNKNAAYAAVFVANCFLTAAFEELLFRGLLFNALCESSPKTVKGVLRAIIISSVIFGAAHFLNLFGGAAFLPTLAQAGYTSLIGALCAFVLFKTHNIIFPWLVHAVYNVGGLILTREGLGNGVVFDTTTIVVTVILGVLVGVFALVSMIKTKETECEEYAFTALKRISRK